MLFLSSLLCLVLLVGFYAGFDSRGALSDRSMLLGEPVPEGIIAVHDFTVTHSPSEIDEMSAEIEATIPVYLARDASISDRVSMQIEEIILAAMEMETMADYFGDRVRTLYETGLVDMEELRDAYSGSRAVIHGQLEESVSELFTVQEARESMRLDLQRRGIPDEKIPQIIALITADLSIDPATRDSVVSSEISAIPEVMREFRTGEEILPPGGLFTDEIRRCWDAMVVAPEGNHGVLQHIAAKIGLCALLLLLAVAYIAGSGFRFFSTAAEILLLFTAWGTTLLFTVLLARSGIRDVSIFTFTMLGTCITSVFFDNRIKTGSMQFSWFLAFAFSAMFALYSPHPMTTFFLALIPSCTVALLIRDLSDGGVFKALILGALSSVLVFILLSASGSSGSREFTPLVWLLLVGIPLVVTGMVRVLVHPLEILFGVVTPLTYRRLESDGHPLRELLKNQAGGTYIHSQVVASMSEKAAEALGENSKLAFLGGIYHDIGKLTNPGMFIENITNPDVNNPHLNMPPRESARVILAHVYDGVDLARKHHLPSDLRDIINQHHGDSSVRFFLEKARRELPPGAELEESIYHYNCPKPQTVVAAIVMMADSVSSAVTGLGRNATYEEKASTVTRIIDEKAKSGQLDDCSFTPAMQKRTAHVFLDALGTIDYERVKNYPHGK